MHIKNIKHRNRFVRCCTVLIIVAIVAISLTIFFQNTPPPIDVNQVASVTVYTTHCFPTGITVTLEASNDISYIYETEQFVFKNRGTSFWLLSPQETISYTYHMADGTTIERKYVGNRAGGVREMLYEIEAFVDATLIAQKQYEQNH